MDNNEPRRYKLHEILCALLGSRNVYFQPPESIKMNYPAIVYKRDDIPVDHADNKSYTKRTKYRLTLIDHTPDSPYVYKILDLNYCRHTSSYVSDNLNHDTFEIYF